ncbi:MAG: DNA-binding protein [Chloroflexi bacterium]|nr:DNA-binding protein [Chloroflexota bacterium]MBI5714289.1 DNA-binding protein [Chloroflexota bacterium]
MTTITITLPDDRLQKLKELSSFFRISAEDLIRVSIEDLITRPDEEFERIVEYVLEKNAELYKRLA